MRNRIFYELEISRLYIEYCSLYAEYTRKRMNIFTKILITVCTIAGLLGTFNNLLTDSLQNSGLISGVVCIIVAIISFIKEIIPGFLNETKIRDTQDILNFYIGYNEDIERLWYDYEYSKTNEHKLSKRFYDIKNKEKYINDLVNSTIINKPKKIVKKQK